MFFSRNHRSMGEQRNCRFTYVRRGSSPWEFMVMVFSVILSMFRSFIGGILTFVGSILAGLCCALSLEAFEEWRNGDRWWLRERRGRCRDRNIER